jgi:uncharacterized membrane protein (DUF4010 family)
LGALAGYRHLNLNQLTRVLPPEGVKILLVLFLSFLVGIEREEQEHSIDLPAGNYIFGGVRTFPLIGLIGYALALLSGESLMLVAVGFAVTGGFLWLSYKHKLDRYGTAGATTEISALAIYVVGALVSHGYFWIATTISVLSVLLLELKVGLEGLSRRLPGAEVLAFTKFLLLTAVILPVVPNRDYGPFALNPFKTWLIVVAASSISYASYLLQKWDQGRGGVFVSAMLGGAYSSTVTTVVLAKRARHEQAPHVWAGGILTASGVMYFRLLVLVAFFSRALTLRLLAPFISMGVLGVLGGWIWSRLPEATPVSGNDTKMDVQNPLELSAAFLFALLFVVLLVATHYAVVYGGRSGIYGLAALSGLTDVAPFALGLTQSAGTATPMMVAVGGIVVAASSNNLVKGFYAFGFADRKTGRQALALLALFAAVGLLPLLFRGH